MADKFSKPIPETNTAKEIEALFAAFPEPRQQDIICRFANGQDVFREEQSDLKQNEDYDIVDGQKPKYGAVGCSDTRVDLSKLFSIERVGRVLTLETPGGCLLWGKKPTAHALIMLDLLAKYGVPDVVISQHYGCGAMAINRDYHGSKGVYHGDRNFAAHVRRNFPGFHEFCKAQKIRYKEVKDLGLKHFEDMGIPLDGSDSDCLQQALAVHQALVCSDFVSSFKLAAEKRGSDYKYPSPIPVYQHFKLGRTFVYSKPDEAWVPVPLLQKTTVPKSLKNACTCGCHHK